MAREHAAVLSEAVTKLRAAETALQTARDHHTALRVQQAEARRQWQALDAARQQPGFAARPAEERRQHIAEMNGLRDDIQRMHQQLPGTRLARNQAQQAVEEARAYKLACLGIHPPSPKPAPAEAAGQREQAEEQARQLWRQEMEQRRREAMALPPPPPLPLPNPAWLLLPNWELAALPHARELQLAQAAREARQAAAAREADRARPAAGGAAPAAAPQQAAGDAAAAAAAPQQAAPVLLAAQARAQGRAQVEPRAEARQQLRQAPPPRRPKRPLRRGGGGGGSRRGRKLGGAPGRGSAWSTRWRRHSRRSSNSCTTCWLGWRGRARGRRARTRCRLWARTEAGAWQALPGIAAGCCGRTGSMPPQRQQ